MIVDHVWFLRYPEVEVFRVIGRIAFSLFLFLVWRNHSYRWRNDLWLWWILLQIALWIAASQGLIDLWSANILIAIGLTRVVLWLIKQVNNQALEWIIFIGAMVYAPFFLHIVDYGTLNLVFGILWYRSRKRWFSWSVAWLILGTVIYHLLVMKDVHAFSPSRDIALLGIWILLWWTMIWLTRANTPIRLTQWWDQQLVRISSYALQIYVIQALVLGLIFVLL